MDMVYFHQLPCGNIRAWFFIEEHTFYMDINPEMDRKIFAMMFLRWIGYVREITSVSLQNMNLLFHCINHEVFPPL